MPTRSNLSAFTCFWAVEACSPSNTNTPHQLRFLDLSPTITAAANWPTPNPATAPTRAYWTTPSGPSNSCSPNTAHGGHGARAGWLGLTLGYKPGPQPGICPLGSYRRDICQPARAPLSYACDVRRSGFIQPPRFLAGFSSISRSSWHCYGRRRRRSLRKQPPRA